MTFRQSHPLYLPIYLANLRLKNQLTACSELVDSHAIDMCVGNVQNTEDIIKLYKNLKEIYAYQSIKQTQHKKDSKDGRVCLNLSTDLD